MFSDVGALVYFLKAPPWLVAGGHIDVLLGLQRRHEQGEPLEFAESRFLIEATRR